MADPELPMPALELWGGHECSVTRVGDDFGDQSRRSGHDERIDDLDRFARLGLDRLRYPVLWEQVAPDRPDQRDWHRPSARLDRLRTLGLRPIVGLLHHGSGPRYTNLLDPAFAPGFARFAGEAAARFDWVGDWTPINEPLTTARFSALYGHWYPHLRDERAFWTALLNQIDAIRLAMAAIRRSVPGARLIQTEDLGRTWATAPLTDQAGFDNSRRWMTWDLLCGRVVPGHDLWRRLGGYGLGDRLRAIADAPCPPDVIGVNHYLTSDRFLDHRTARYPPQATGGNGRLAYADVEAVRVLDPPTPGFSGALREAWERYGIPVAATEVHNGSTREEQMRWFDEAWATARRLRGEGVEVQAVTSWALLGSHGWDRLLTAEGRYESGAFDVSQGDPRETSVAGLLRGDRHPVLAGQGWWRRPQRLLHAPVPRPAPMRERPIARCPAACAPLLVTGADAALAAGLASACAQRDIPVLFAEAAGPEPWAVVEATDDMSTELSHCQAMLDRLIDEASALAIPPRQEEVARKARGGMTKR